MAVFHDVLFPKEIAYGAVGGPKFKTTIVTLTSGYEQRNIDWSQTRGEWDVSYGLKTQSELNVIRNFFMARHGKAYAFRFKDWMDFDMPRQSIGTTNALSKVFQIYKRYQDAASFFDRDLTKPVAGTVAVWVNGVGVTPGNGTGNFAVDLTTGKITLGSGFATAGQLVEAQCNFDVPVRFDTDHLATSITEYNVFVWGQIPLVEVRQ